MLKVYGVRICPECKGICHENSWRKKYGQRRRYFCCERHLRNSVDPDDVWGDDWSAFRDSAYERVEVITV